MDPITLGLLTNIIGGSGGGGGIGGGIFGGSNTELEPLADVEEIDDGGKSDNTIIIFVIALFALAAIGFFVFGNGNKNSK